MATIDVNGLVDNIMGVGTSIVRQDISTISGFAQQQVTELAQQADTIAAMQVAGVFDGDGGIDLRNHFTSELQEMTKNFAHTLEGLAAITVEKLINAVVNVLWDAIGTATGVALPLPRV